MLLLLRLLPGLLPFALLLSPAAAQAQQVQLRCDGTLLEARGSAEQKRSIDRLRFSLGLTADAATADGALSALQERLAAVRSALQRLQVQELEVTSPTTWSRPATRKLPAGWEASLQVGGQVAPAQLQNLIRQVGALPGVRLSPVSTEADRAADPLVRRQLLRAAYQDALRQAREVAEAIGLGTPTPLEVQIESGFRPMLLKGMAAEAAPPFDPAELPSPVDRLGLLVRFCSR